MFGGRTAKQIGVAIGLLAGAGSLIGTSQAADLGGDCCADLEERIAELEATAARKGNRKVSLEIYGHVNEAVLFWDDGVESNAYVVTNDNSRSRFGFRGKAKINSEFEAGYRLEVGIRGANSKRANQDNPDGNANPLDVGLDLRDSYWYLKSKTYGAASVGLQASATDQITEINQTQTAFFSKYSDVEDSGLGFFLRSAVNGQLTSNTITPLGSPTTAPGDSGLTWRRLIGDGGDQPGEGERRFNLVKYESPELAGFTASASWGQDDFWDVALRYKTDFQGFTIAAGIGYGELTDGYYLQTKTVCISREPNSRDDSYCRQFGGSFSILHVDTGLFLQAGAGRKEDTGLDTMTLFSGPGPEADPNQDFWSVQAGIEKKWLSYGKTTIYGEYYDYSGGAGRRTVSGTDALAVDGSPGPSGAVVWDSGVNIWGAGLAQGFDSAALILYLQYRHIEGDLTLRGTTNSGASRVANGDVFNAPIDDLDIVMTGGIIRF